VVGVGVVYEIGGDVALVDFCVAPSAAVVGEGVVW
jgi:hypothetical protein